MIAVSITIYISVAISRVRLKLPGLLSPALLSAVPTSLAMMTKSKHLVKSGGSSLASTDMTISSVNPKLQTFAAVPVSPYLYLM